MRSNKGCGSERASQPQLTCYGLRQLFLQNGSFWRGGRRRGGAAALALAVGVFLLAIGAVAVAAIALHLRIFYVADDKVLVLQGCA